MEIKEYRFKVENILFLIKQQDDKITSIDIYLVPLANKWKGKIEENNKTIRLLYKFFRRYFKDGIVEDLPDDILDLKKETLEYKVLTTLKNKTLIGSRLSYQELAELAGLKKTYARVIGKILSNNKFAIVFPCHRVIRSDGAFGSYKWGKELKKILLEKEKRITERKLNFIQGLKLK